MNKYIVWIINFLPNDTGFIIKTDSMREIYDRKNKNLAPPLIQIRMSNLTIQLNFTFLQEFAILPLSRTYWSRDTGKLLWNFKFSFCCCNFIFFRRLTVLIIKLETLIFPLYAEMHNHTKFGTNFIVPIIRLIICVILKFKIKIINIHK